MESLNNYIDFWQYCDTLSEITKVDIDNVIKIVRATFADINNGVITSELGFQRIESQLTHRAYRLKAENAKRGKAVTRIGEIPPAREYAKRLIS